MEFAAPVVEGLAGPTSAFLTSAKALEVLAGKGYSLPVELKDQTELLGSDFYIKKTERIFLDANH